MQVANAFNCVFSCFFNLPLSDASNFCVFDQFFVVNEQKSLGYKSNSVFKVHAMFIQCVLNAC